MNDNDIKCLNDIIFFCRMVNNTIKRFGSSFEIFDSDIDYFNSVNLSLLHIGETAKKLTDEFKNNTNTIIPWNKIIHTRNIEAHDYDGIEKRIIWNVIKNDIPVLQAFCEDKLKEFSPQLELDL